jgi:hypothetical protein
MPRHASAGSATALNSGVFRTGFNADAIAWLNGAYNPTGDVEIPPITVHTIGDGLGVVEKDHESCLEFAEESDQGKLFQLYRNAVVHCQFFDTTLAGELESQVNWVKNKQRPTKEGVIRACAQFQTAFCDSCNFNPTFQPGEFEARIPPRQAPGQP